MIEIIKKGISPSERTYVGTCMGCTTVVRFKEGEATLTFDRNDTLYFVTCPVCNGQIYGNREKIHPGGRKTYEWDR